MWRATSFRWNLIYRFSFVGGSRFDLHNKIVGFVLSYNVGNFYKRRINSLYYYFKREILLEECHDIGCSEVSNMYIKTVSYDCLT